MENTITEHDLDPATREYLQGLDCSEANGGHDLDVDGLDESFLSRLLSLFGRG